MAVTSFDSGAYTLTGREKAAGWKSRGGIAYSSKIKNVEAVLHDQFDEWYVFENQIELGQLFPGEANPLEMAPKLGEVCVLVNYQGFALDAPETDALTKVFWKQMDWIRPLAYIAEGTCLNYATLDKHLFATVYKALRK